MPIAWNFDSVDGVPNIGYIHQSRIKYLYELPLFRRKIIDNTAFFEKDGINITIKIGTYNIDEERIIKDPEYHYPVKIDGCDAWGSDCFSTQYPENNTEIKSIEISIDGITKKLEQKDISGYLCPSLNYTFIAMGSDSRLYIAMSNGDGAGSYELLWVYKDDAIIQKSAYIGF